MAGIVMTSHTPWLAITLFNLLAGRDVDSYRRYSDDFIRPGMLAMPSVVGFRDYEALQWLDSSASPWQLVEVIEITSPKEFVHDNETMPGKAVADDWSTWVSDFKVLVCKDLL